MTRLAADLPGYSYGAAEIARSSVSLEELAELKVSAGFTDEDERFLRVAGQVLGDQTEQIVHHWRSQIIAGIPLKSVPPAVGTETTVFLPASCNERAHETDDCNPGCN